MTAKEKAMELVDKYNYVTALNLTCDIQTTEQEIHNHAKKCALIAVNEIFELDIYKSFNIDPKFWTDVKIEIKKL